MTEATVLTSGRTRFGISLPIVVVLLVYPALLLNPRRMLGDPDTYWHIATGRWIIVHRTVPYHDMFSFSMPGAPWTSPEWLAEVLSAWLFDHLGWAGLVAVTALCATAAFAMLLHALLRWLAPMPAMIATALAPSLVLPHLLARPHVLALPILVRWIDALVTARSEQRAPSLWLLPLVTLWANIHSSYILGLGLAALLGGEAVLLAEDWRARRQAARRWSVFGVLAVAAALINPYGVEGLLLPFRLIGMGTLNLIGEWQSPDFQHFQPVELWLVVVLFAALAFGWRLPPTRVAMVLLLLHMALRHGRYAELLGLVAPLLLAPALAPQLAATLGRRPPSAADRLLAELARPATTLGIALGAVLIAGLTAVALHLGVQRQGDGLTPQSALAAVAAEHIEGPVLNDYRFGGYLIFAGVKPFIDGRYFYGDEFLKRDYDATAGIGDELPRLLDEYAIAWTLMPPGTTAVGLLDHLPDWRRLYADDIAIVHVRQSRDPAPAHDAGEWREKR